MSALEHTQDFLMVVLLLMVQKQDWSWGLEDDGNSDGLLLYAEDSSGRECFALGLLSEQILVEFHNCGRTVSEVSVIIPATFVYPSYRTKCKHHDLTNSLPHSFSFLLKEGCSSQIWSIQSSSWDLAKEEWGYPFQLMEKQFGYQTQGFQGSTLVISMAPCTLGDIPHLQQLEWV